MQVPPGRYYGIEWHRKGFKLYWALNGRRRDGRPRVDPEVRRLVCQMANENIGWRAPRIHGELLKLGFEVSQATVSRYIRRRRKPPSQTWKTFLLNHTDSLASIDFFVVPTATFRILYVFLVLEHNRRRVVHFNVTEGPSARWTGQQIVNAFPYDSPPKYLIRECDTTYGADKDAPEPRQPSDVEEGKVVALPNIGGLHHHYTRRAA